MILLHALVTLLLVPTLAQVQENQGLYKSDFDQLVTIRKISVLPFLDNVQGIYSRPLEVYFTDLVRKGHRWDYVEANTVGPLLSPDELDENPQKLTDLSASLKSDAFFSTRISRGPNGITILMNLYLTQDHQLFAKAEVRDFKKTDIESLKDQMNALYKQILARIPYVGLVLSRQGNRVTLNLGSSDGLKKDEQVTVIQVVNLNRHPKFHFLIGAEKAILGRIKILKVDETLSFAMIVSEREKGAIQKGAKIGPLEFVKYDEPISLNGVTSPEDKMRNAPDSHVVLGKDPDVWVPQKPASYGIVGVRAGLGSLNAHMSMVSAGSLDTSSSFYPAVALDAELWITEEMSVHASIRQGIVSLNNPQPSSGGPSTPGSLSGSLSSYDLLFGYNLRFGSGDVWGPKVEGLIGLSSYKLMLDNSTPTTLTSMTFSGIKFGLDGSTPIFAGTPWGVGGQVFFFINPSLSESPVSSGSSSTASINQFGAYGYYKWSEHIKFKLQMDFELYAANFSGVGTRSGGDSATNGSQRLLTLWGGAYYLF